MGLNTRLYINISWSVEDVKDVIEKRFKVPVTLKFHDWACGDARSVAHGQDGLVYDPPAIFCCW